MEMELNKPFRITHFVDSLVSGIQKKLTRDIPPKSRSTGRRRIAIIGGGFTGLTAAFELSKRGHKVTVFEKEQTIGGLAGGYKRPNWEWHLEYGYHHLFTNDNAIIALIAELGLSQVLMNKRPVTATYIHNTIDQLDSPANLLIFPYLSVTDKARTAFLLAFCKLNPFWRPLEFITAKQLFLKVGGKRAWETIWEPLMIGKFDVLAPTVSAAWLWARIKKRTPSLYYIEGGFYTLITALKSAIKQHGGTIRTGCNIQHIESRIKNEEWRLKSQNKHNKKYNSQFSILNSQFDSVLLTVPTSIAQKLLSPFSILHSPFSQAIPHLHAQVLILETTEPILDEVYWLNITDRSFPFLAVVAHTNMIDKKYYGGHHITYFGNYLPDGHPYLKMNKEQILNKFTPYIKQLNPNFDSKLFTFHFSLFTCYNAQPVHQLHFSAMAPPLKTPISNLYLANLDSIFPWDRGTNYAVELGRQVATLIEKDAK